METFFAQEAHHQFAYGWFIIDDQYDATAISSIGNAYCFDVIRCACRFGFGDCRRKFYREGGALPHLAGNSDVTTHHLAEALADSQAKPRSSILACRRRICL